MAAKKGSRVFVWVILGLLFFGLVGFGARGFGGTIRSLGTVGDKDVAVQDYARDLNQQIRAFSAQIGSPVSFPQAQAAGLDQQVLSQLVTRRVLDNEVTRLGLSVGDERVREQIVAIQAFQGLNGQFDRTVYRSSLDRQNMTEAAFETGLREEMARTLLQGAVLGGVPQPETYMDTLVQFVAENRAITWTSIDAAALTAPVPGATDTDLQAWYDAHPDDFTLPETRALTYVWLTPAMIQDAVEIDEQALRDLYQQRIDEFVRPERRLVERLIFTDGAAADAAKARLDAGEIDFDGLVAERGLDLSDVDLGDVAASDLGAAGDAVFAAAPGDVVGPADSTLGPALFRMNAVLAAEEITFEDALPDLRSELAGERARRVIDDARDGIDDLLAGGATLEDLAAQTDMKLGQIAWTADTAEGIAAYDNFRTAAVAAAEGAFPTLGDLSDGGIFALRLDGVTAPVLRPLDDVRDAVGAQVLSANTQAAVVAKAAELATQIEPLTGFDSLGLVPKTEAILTRRSFLEGTPPDFMETVFQMAVGDVQVIDATDTAIIVRLDGLRTPDPADPQVAANRAQLGEAAAAGISQDLFAMFAKVLQENTKVEINQAAVNAVHAQFQ